MLSLSILDFGLQYPGGNCTPNLQLFVDQNYVIMFWTPSRAPNICRPDVLDTGRGPKHLSFRCSGIVVGVPNICRSDVVV